MIWLRTRRLAIGKIVSSPEQWQRLAELGVSSVFSCCDPAEGLWLPPDHWPKANVPLPDHRNPDELDEAQLEKAVVSALELFQSHPALYLHCWAGLERSPLVAVGVLALAESIDFFDALAQVRAAHPQARPITAHLVVLEQIVRRLRNA